jgi:hypothetical protein
VAGFLAKNESKILFSKDKKNGPPNEVKQRFDETKLSPFALMPTVSMQSELRSLSRRVLLNFGENLVYHNPLNIGPDDPYCVVHAYLKRILVTATIPDAVVLYSAKSTEEGSKPKAIKGFQAPKELFRTVLSCERQYSAEVSYKTRLISNLLRHELTYT